MRSSRCQNGRTEMNRVEKQATLVAFLGLIPIIVGIKFQLNMGIIGFVTAGIWLGGVIVIMRLDKRHQPEQEPPPVPPPCGEPDPGPDLWPNPTDPNFKPKNETAWNSNRR